MPRNKSAEVQKLKLREAFLEARLRDMSKEATRGFQDAMAMMELVTEARAEAEAYRNLLRTCGHVPLSDRKLPWENQ